MPWKPCAVVQRRPEKLRCPRPVYATRTARDGRFDLHAPPGHYLLIAGTDSPQDLTRATVHDNVTLRAGTYRLRAPGICTYTNEPHCLPPIPLYTPLPPEVNGDYRLSKIDNDEQQLTCLHDFDAERTERGLVPAVIDEWLVENIRAIEHLKYSHWSGTPSPVDPFGYITSGGQYGFGGKNCDDAVIQGAFGAKQERYSINYSTLWFAGRYHPVVRGSGLSAYGTAEYPIDPRTGFDDPNAPAWP